MPFFEEFLTQVNSILHDIIIHFPKLILALLIFALALILIKYVNRLIKWLVKVSKIEDFIESILPGGLRIPISLTFTILASTGILITATALAVRIFVPEYTQLYGATLGYLARVASVIVISLIFVFGLDALVRSVKLEKKMDSFLLMIAFLLILAVLIDLTALSVETKSALDFGIAIGMGLAIGAFAVWLFFGEHLITFGKKQ
ncbi:MAG: hypothetical protein N3F64_07440 [Nitrososphaeria archaeon]|nr:hypothetical protein [Nitrososphaeria archaeon]